MRRYLELRLHGTAYCRRRADAAGAGVGPVRCACRHPLHTDHFHYFGCRDLVASFKYTPVVLSDVVLAERTTVLFFFSISFLDDQRQSCRCQLLVFLFWNRWWRSSRAAWRRWWRRCAP